MPLLPTYSIFFEKKRGRVTKHREDYAHRIVFYFIFIVPASADER